MNKHDISTFIRFNFWANGCLLTTCQKLTTDQFTRAVTPDPGWGSLRGVLVHMLDTEYGWRSVLQAQEDNILNEADFADVAALQARWAVEEAAWQAYVTTLSDETLHQQYGKATPNSPKVWQTMMHVVMHSVQHRSEAAAILTGYGHSPGELDFGLFLKAQTDAAE